MDLILFGYVSRSGYVEKDGRQGILCKLCMKQGKVPRNVPCFTLSKDKIKKHVVSNMHWGAIVDEAELSTGGIPCAFKDTVTLKMKAAVRCCKCIYWLCKQEISHTIT